jgi:MAM domain, meprin/A5/mu/Pregnancy-associated plasma protein-A/SprB repeat/Secretion system C-terminal sorting domain
MQHFIKFCFCWSVLLLHSSLTAQDCGTHPTAAQIEYLTQTREARQAFDITQQVDDRFGASIHWVPMQFHECLNSSTTFPALSEMEISAWLGEVNELFLPYRIQFYECGSHNVFINTTLYSFDITEEPQLSAWEIPNVINVYIFGSVTSAGQSLGGYSYLPPSADRIVLSRAYGNLFDNKVFIHELGHYLGLYHTHGKTNNGTTDELVNGSNCLTAGDDVCDTPADPNLRYSASNCVYTGTARDLNNHAYVPQVPNHMSYAPTNCRNQFTVGQMNRMAYTTIHDRGYLQGCAHPSGCENPITQLPVVFDFETGLDGWINKTYENFGPFVDFVHATGPVEPNTTGPEQAQSGNGYVYFDGAASGVNGANAALISPCIDLRGQAAPKMSLYYHAFGPGIGDFGAQVSLDGGHTYIGLAPDYTIFLVSGDQGNAWQSITCDLSPFKNAAALQVRLLVSSQELGDIAVDSIAFYNDPQSNCNLSLTSNIQDVSCHGAANGSIALTPSGTYVAPVTYAWSNGAATGSISNLSPGLYTVTATATSGCSVIAELPILSPNYLYGSTTQTNVSVYGQNTGGAAVQPVGGQLPYTYLWSNGATTAAITGIGAGVYTVTITDQNACTITRSVTITQPAIVCSATYNWLPWVSSVDQNLGVFMQESADNFNWTRQSGATPTSQTGPNAAYNGTHYWFTKASGGNAPNKTASMKTSQCLELTVLNNPVFEFYYHMYGNQMGSLSVEVSVNNELTWTTVWSKSGNQGNAWYKASIDLLPYRTPHTKIRIKGVTGTGSRSDMAIDAMYIGEPGNNLFLPELEAVPIAGMTVYPNPSTGWFELRMDDGIVCEKADIYNAAGQLIWSESTSSSLLSFDLTGQSPGCYYLRVQSGDTVEVVKVMLTR